MAAVYNINIGGGRPNRNPHCRSRRPLLESLTGNGGRWNKQARAGTEGGRVQVHNFAVTGVGGFVAPRHLKAINATGNRLIAAVDPHDAVGVLDRYSFDVRFFTDSSGSIGISKSCAAAPRLRACTT